MPKIETIQPGDVLYDYRKSSPPMRTMTNYKIEVLEVNLQNRSVLVSCNGNKPHWVHNQNSILKWRRTPGQIQETAWDRIARRSAMGSGNSNL